MISDYDPEIAPFAELLRAQSREQPHSTGWQSMRDQFNAALELQASMLPPFEDVRRAAFTTTRSGDEIRLRWYTSGAPSATHSGAAVVYLHGGAMIAGSVDLYDRTIAAYVASTGVPFLAVDYRLAPQLTGDGLVRDAFAGLEWLVAHAASLDLDSSRIAVMGDSAGGGIAAGTALLARDRGIDLAKQLLIYPMLDDRNTVPDPHLADLAFFSYAQNQTGWATLLGEAFGTSNVSELAAPARATQLAGLAPAYFEVGGLDIFRDETLDYSRRLLSAGVSTEVHLYAGAPHGFDRLPGVRLAATAMARREDILRAL